MTSRVKILLIVLGYGLAFLLATAIVYVNQTYFQNPVDAQAASGMYAFGDMILFLGAFGSLALIPTVAGCLFFKSFKKFWTICSSLGLAFAIFGVVAEVANIILSRTPVFNSSSPGAIVSVLGILHMFCTPITFALFLIVGFIAPKGKARNYFYISASLEFFVGLYTVFNFLVFQRFF
jgi:hypothetical protein